jgi:hypothetical protein
MTGVKRPYAADRLTGSGVLVLGDVVAVERGGAEVARRTVEGLGRFVAAARQLKLGWGQLPDDAEVIYLCDAGDGGFGAAVRPGTGHQLAAAGGWGNEGTPWSHPTYLTVKATGAKSLSGKRGTAEGVEDAAPPGSHDTVKAGWLASQLPATPPNAPRGPRPARGRRTDVIAGSKVTQERRESVVDVGLGGS